MTAFVTAASSFTLNSVKVPVELSRKLRRADDYIRLAVIAAFHTMLDRRDCDSFNSERCGLVLGSAFSTMQTNFEVLDDVVSGKQTSPTLFSHSVFNAAAGYIASTLDIKGGALTINDFSFPFFKALEQGYLDIMTGRIDNCLVLQVETYSDLLFDGRTRLVEDSTPWQPGVVCLLLEKEKKEAATALCLDTIEITRKACGPEAFLIGRQQVMIGAEDRTLFDPLGAGILLSQLLGKKSCQGKSFSVNSDWGKVQLQLSKQTP